MRQNIETSGRRDPLGPPRATEELVQRFYALFDDAPVGLYRTTPDGRLLNVNRALVETLGYPDRESLMSINVAELYVDPDDRRVWREIVDRGVGVRDHQWQLRRHDGRVIWVRDTARPIRDEDGRVRSYEGAIEDVTEQRIAEEALRASESRYRRLVERVPGVVYSAEIGEQGTWRYVSPRLESMLGFSPREWIEGNLWRTRIHPADREGVLETERASRAGGTSFAAEYRLIARDGREVWVRDEATVQVGEDGRPVLLEGLLYDITASKAAETELLQTNAELEVLHDTALGLVEELDPSELLPSIVAQAASLVGSQHGYLYTIDPSASSEEMTCTVGTGLFEDAVGVRIRRGHGLAGRVWERRQLLAVDDYSSWEGRHRVFDELPIRAVVGLPLQAGEEVVGVIGVVRLEEGRTFTPAEVELLERFARLASLSLHNARLYSALRRELAERERVESSLRRRNRELAALSETTAGLIAGLDPERVLRTVIDRAAELMGTDHAWLSVLNGDAEELEVRLGVGLFEEWVGYRQPRGVGLDGQVWDEERAIAVEDYAAWSHRMREFDESGMGPAAAVPLRAGSDMAGVIGVARVEKGRAFTVEELELLERLAYVASLALQAARLYRRLEEELAERRQAEERFRTLSEAAWEGIAIHDAGRILEASGTFAEMWGYDRDEIIGMSAVDLIAPESQDRLTRALEHPSDDAFELVARRKDGGHFVIEVAGKSVPYRGRMVRVTAVRDVTARREAEDALRAAYEREREAAERLRVVDEMKNSFLEAVSHDLRTPLTSVLGYAVTLQRPELEISREERREMLDLLVANARKLERLLSDLLDLDRLLRGVIEPHRKPTALEDLVAAVVEETDLRGRPIEIIAEPVVIQVDPAKIERIVENLLVNAMRHTPPGTRLWVRVARVEGGALLAVEDEGAGVPGEEREAIFDAFRRGTHSPGHAPGSGIGLSLVGRFAELHGGRAWVEERPGGGASFRVFLPDVPRAESA